MKSTPGLWRCIIASRIFNCFRAPHLEFLLLFFFLLCLSKMVSSQSLKICWNWLHTMIWKKESNSGLFLPKKSILKLKPTFYKKNSKTKMSGILAEGKLFKAKTKLFLKKIPSKNECFQPWLFFLDATPRFFLICFFEDSPVKFFGVGSLILLKHHCNYI